jgi:hypothetical protein
LLIHLFRGPERIFGFTEDAGGANLPSDYGPWSHSNSLEMEEGKPQSGVNVGECIKDVRAHGFHITDAHVRITDRAVENVC